MSENKQIRDIVVLIKPSYHKFSASIALGSVGLVFIVGFMFVNNVSLRPIVIVLGVGMFGAAYYLFEKAYHTFSQVRMWTRLGFAESHFPANLEEIHGWGKLATEAFERQLALVAGLCLVQEAVEAEIKDQERLLSEFGLDNLIQSLDDVNRFHYERAEVVRGIFCLKLCLESINEYIEQAKRILTFAETLLIKAWKLPEHFPSLSYENINSYKDRGIDVCYYKLDERRRLILHGEIIRAGSDVMRRLKVTLTLTTDEQRRLGQVIV